MAKLMADKIHQHYGYSCDGPGRGGTCDISAWDSFYLATFWMLNTGAWITFYFHWKHFTLWQNTLFQFDESSTYLNAWFRDYLWLNQLPHGCVNVGPHCPQFYGKCSEQFPKITKDFPRKPLKSGHLHFFMANELALNG